MSKLKNITAIDLTRIFRVSGTTRLSSIPGYDLCVLLFGVLAVSQILRALMVDEALSSWRIVVLIVTIFLTLFFSYKAHTANDVADTIPS